MSAPLMRTSALLCPLLLALGLAACGTTVSTAGFKGEEHDVAQAISNLQTDATAGDQHKLCANDLAGPVVARLSGAARGSSGTRASALAGCEKVIKTQLAEVDNLDTSVQSVRVSAPGRLASARVKSTWSAKSRVRTVRLQKEGKGWKISGIE